MSDDAAGARYTFGEELANACTHGFGLLLSIVGLIVLISAASALRSACARSARAASMVHR